MSIYTCKYHNGWCMQATWSKIEYENWLTKKETGYEIWLKGTNFILPERRESENRSLIIMPWCKIMDLICGKFCEKIFRKSFVKK